MISFNCKTHSKLLILYILLLVYNTPLSATPHNISYFGNLVTEPCIVSPEDGAIDINFGTIIDSYIYKYIRTPAQVFTIRLQDCDISVSNSLMITFQGAENSFLPGFLALRNNSSAKGIAIGLEYENGEPLSLNTSSKVQKLVNGENILKFYTFVKGEPGAIENKSITVGFFSSFATFIFDYQ